MAAPNIVNVATINGESQGFELDTTLTTSLMLISTGKLVKINRMTVANIDGTNAADVSIKYFDGSTTRSIASTISVPADATLSLIDKNNGFYLEENEKISGIASANSDLECLISYEVIAD